MVSIIARFRAFTRSLLRKQALEAELDAELRSVLDMMAEEKMAAGATEREAYRRARLELGGLEQVKTSVREARHGSWLEVALQDARFALRQFRRSPTFAIVAVLTLSLGIGANTAVFSVVSAVLLRPLPYADEDRVVMIQNAHADGPLALSELEFFEYETLNDAFEHTGVYVTNAVTLTGEGEAERLPAAFASAGALTALGVDPILGRAYTVEEDLPGGEGLVLISDALWERRFGRDPEVVGRTVSMNGLARVVLGVLPAGFRLPGGFQAAGLDALLPLRIDPANPDPRNIHYLTGVGRLASGVTLGGASAQLAAAAGRVKGRLGDRLPDTFTASAIPVREQVLGDVRPALMILLGAVALVLLIACVNVANLLLARSDARAREMAVRASLGARQGRLIRQLCTETLVLGLVGGLGGLGLGLLGARALVAMSPPGVPRLGETGADVTVFAFCLLVTVTTSILVGLFPALRISRGEPGDALRGARGATGGLTGMRTRRSLVMGQVALAALLSIGAGLLVRSFSELGRVELGFDESGLLTFQVALPTSEYPEAIDTRLFFDELRREVAGLPGVEEVGGTTGLPLWSSVGDWGVRIRGRGPDGLGEQGPDPDWMVVTPGYFEAMRIPVRQGRALLESDVTDGRQTVVINEAFARRQWPAGDALGAQLRMTTDLDTLWRTVVGIVGDIRQTAPELEPRHAMYLPHAQFPSSDPDGRVGQLNLVVRTAGTAPSSIAPAVRRVAAEIDPNLAVSNVQTMRDVTRAATSTASFQSVLFAGFAALALVLV
ncbi:MAG: ABC transporter permease, partial [Gemmatimonadetes bacterium]|nr:ABC transporter permease [Gemmatimonadota bacterium]